MREWNQGTSFPSRITCRASLVACLALALIDLGLSGAPAPASRRVAAYPPLALHPANPRVLLFRGQPVLLISSGEHYGAVLNRDFDFEPYLDELQRHGFNQTRVFSGAYREVPGSFNIPENTLAPAPEAFLCPWPRTGVPGARDGGTKFDLRAWNPDYFARLKAFVAAAGRRGVVVEVVLFCTFYDDRVWDASPLNPANNVNEMGPVGRLEAYSLKNAALSDAQVALAAKIATELREFDNVYYELCNEPYERGGLTRAWNDRIITAIRAAEAGLPAPHLIAQGAAWRAGRVTDPDPRISIFNFHAAGPESVAANDSLDRALIDDETGGKGTADLPYRREAWEFMLGGGSGVSHLDFSFTTRHPRGTFDFRSASPKPPGGGGAAIRRQLQVLKQFLERFDLVRMRPDHRVVQGGAPPPVGSPPGARAAVRALSDPGRAYALYVSGGEQVDLALALPGGDYRAEWVNPRTGGIDRVERFAHRGGERRLSSPRFSEDIALRVVRDGAAPR